MPVDLPDTDACKVRQLTLQLQLRHRTTALGWLSDTGACIHLASKAEGLMTSITSRSCATPHHHYSLRTWQQQSNSARHARKRSDPRAFTQYADLALNHCIGSAVTAGLRNTGNALYVSLLARSNGFPNAHPVVTNCQPCGHQFDRAAGLYTSSQYTDYNRRTLLAI